MATRRSPSAVCRKSALVWASLSFTPVIPLVTQRSWVVGDFALSTFSPQTQKKAEPGHSASLALWDKPNAPSLNYLSPNKPHQEALPFLIKMMFCCNGYCTYLLPRLWRGLAFMLFFRLFFGGVRSRVSCKPWAWRRWASLEKQVQIYLFTCFWLLDGRSIEKQLYLVAQGCSIFRKYFFPTLDSY